MRKILGQCFRLLTSGSWALYVLGAATPAFGADWDPDSEADNYADFWLRLDADRTGGELWAGTTTPIGRVNLASNLVFTQHYPDAVDPKTEAGLRARLGGDARAPAIRAEAGPAIASGGLFVLPKIGIGYDFEREKVAPLVPQVMLIVEGGPAYIESWVQFFFYDMFAAGAQDSFYTRDVVAVALSNHVALGVEAELTVALKNAPGGALRSLAVGPRVTVSPTEALALGLFVGYESQASARQSTDDFLAGRFTATLLW